ncbi:MAG TPA: glycoside hydrolase family 16 protein [Chloroflexia bacterium]|nr:glycoside hydrolase family 16 protein [Chloroflexia bacterium]
MVDKPSSGDVESNPLQKPGYRLEFHDEFDDPVLDAAKWVPYYLPQWSSRAQSRPHYCLKESQLVLQINREQQPWCPEFDGEVKCSSIQTGLFAGPVGSKLGQHRFNFACVVREAQTNVQTYTPRYGYFELRAKGPATGANLASMWMIGYEDIPERSGEIALFEVVGAHHSPGASRIRYGLHPWSDPKLKEEFYEELLPCDTARYHIYGLEWTPDRIDFYFDNHKIRTIPQSPDYPMQFMLGLYELPAESAWTGKYDPLAPYPKEFSIDYFRAYQPEAGY